MGSSSAFIASQPLPPIPSAVSNTVIFFMLLLLLLLLWQLYTSGCQIKKNHNS